MPAVDFNEVQLSAALEKAIKFSPKEYKKAPNKIVANDLVGVEIELERWAAPAGDEAAIHEMWQEHDEGSLVNGREFVLYPPANGSRLENGLDTFFGSGAEYVASERASVHIHVDMMNDFTVGQFRSMMILTYILEGAIYRIADENRKWASYSCPLIDMRVTRFNALLLANTKAAFKAALAGAYHEEKYYGFNAVSLCKHGTIEFRYFPCTRDGDVVYNWVNMCLELKNAARAYTDPKKLAAQLDSGKSIQDFVKKNMPATAEALLMYMDMNDTLARVLCVSAVLNDKNALRELRQPDFDEPPSKSFNKLMAHVNRPLQEREALKKKHKVVEVDMIEVYRNMLAQAKKNNNPRYVENR